MFSRFTAAVAAIGLLCAAPALAKVKAAKEFAFPANEPVKIAVFRPDVMVGKMTTGGVEEPNAEWTATARAKLAAELARAQSALGREVVMIEQPMEDANPAIAEYQALFRAVTIAIANHGGVGLLSQTLPSKHGKFDWTLGPGAAKLAEITGANYALMMFTHDSYGTAGRKAVQLLAAGLFGVYVAPGIHVSYAALVDLKSGDVVWINVDPESGGDPREDDGATKRVRQMLTKFPGSKALESPGAQ
ncbi:hypothetical protein [Sphingomonas sp.]|uniref:hypothetical protein n=1 Tax=Sphingomonas sp. TaxID=28214 RepID=UPI001DF2EA42|nr:hypothetical protein [Sphingomonas sp.]MBX9796654.1 hypothetical protein [Sphingomonas sp.]